MKKIASIFAIVSLVFFNTAPVFAQLDATAPEPTPTPVATTTPAVEPVATTTPTVGYVGPKTRHTMQTVLGL